MRLHMGKRLSSLRRIGKAEDRSDDETDDNISLSTTEIFGNPSSAPGMDDTSDHRSLHGEDSVRSLKGLLKLMPLQKSDHFVKFTSFEDDNMDENDFDSSSDSENKTTLNSSFDLASCFDDLDSDEGSLGDETQGTGVIHKFYMPSDNNMPQFMVNTDDASYGTIWVKSADSAQPHLELNITAHTRKVARPWTPSTTVAAPRRRSIVPPLA